MRKYLVLGITAALFLTSCGGSGDDAADTTAAATTVTTSSAAEPAPTDAPATDAPATEPPATVAPATEPPATEAPAPAALTPEVVCVDTSSDQQDDVAFAYTNDADTAVVLDAAASTVTGGDPADAEFVPTVFAPGQVSPAFWTTAARRLSAVSWTIVGPDGTSRTATVDDSTPECTRQLLAATTPDDRDPAFVLSEPTVSSDGTVTFTASVSDVETSACPDGLEAGTPAVRWRVANDAELVVIAGPTATWTLPLQDGALGGPNLSAAVVDSCGADGATQVMWPNGRAFAELFVGEPVCVVQESRRDVSVVLGSDDPNDDCSRLPATGGTRIRPN